MAFSTSLQTLVAERDAAFISRVATELNLSLEELTVKYADVAAMAFKLPKKRMVRAETKPDSKACKGTTAKGAPCKFSALHGGECCKRHSREPSDEVKPPKEKKEKKEKPIKVVPKHTHDLDSLEHADCPLCLSQDGPFKLPTTPLEVPPPGDESDSEDLTRPEDDEEEMTVVPTLFEHEMLSDSKGDSEFDEE